MMNMTIGNIFGPLLAERLSVIDIFQKYANTFRRILSNAHCFSKLQNTLVRLSFVLLGK